MYIPRYWHRAADTGTAGTPSAWGWGDTADEARRKADERLRSLRDRISRGDGWPEKYAYGNRPLKEQILETIGDADAPDAIVSRNHFGSKVLNTARLLFLDIDLAAESGWHGFLRKLGLRKDTPESMALDQLRAALGRFGRGTFRIYRTAAGLRVMAVDREFNPKADDTRRLMEETGTDPAFIHLCRVQESFRARLTPKHWRCGVGQPPGRHPRTGRDEQFAFSTWLRDYEEITVGFATCRYLKTIGQGRARGAAAALVELHDRETRCDQDLPLA